MVSLFFFCLGVASTLIAQKKGKQIVAWVKQVLSNDE